MNVYGSTLLLMEFSPLEDCIPNTPVKVNVKNVYWGDEKPSLVGKTVWLCDHNREKTNSLKAGKTYIAFTMVNSSDKRSGEEYPWEYVPEAVFQDEEDPLSWSEVSDGFWKTKKGEEWKNLIDELNKLSFESVPVTPTRSTELLSFFHNGQAAIVEGTDISSDEYENGSKACLVPQGFAELNNLEVGQKIKLQLYFTDYK